MCCLELVPLKKENFKIWGGGRKGSCMCSDIVPSIKKKSKCLCKDGLPAEPVTYNVASSFCRRAPCIPPYHHYLTLISFLFILFVD